MFPLGYTAVMTPLLNLTVLKPERPLPVKYFTLVIATGVLCARRTFWTGSGCGSLLRRACPAAAAAAAAPWVQASANLSVNRLAARSSNGRLYMMAWIAGDKLRG